MSAVATSYGPKPDVSRRTAGCKCHTASARKCASAVTEKTLGQRGISPTAP